ncbi:MAG: hypothetical protein ABIY50_11900 [Ignavibacteria bacterium]
MNHNNNSSNSNSAVKNLTVLWAFSEGFLGGILNAVKIPFKGLLLGNISVTIIIFIAAFSKQTSDILKAGIITTTVKAVISPYYSLPAYVAVFFQTVTGALLFISKKFMMLSGVMLGVITSVLSSVQRIVVLTLLFGNAFWETVDKFAAYVYNEFSGNKELPLNFKFSHWLIGAYILIHAIVGFIVGLYATRLAKKIISENEDRQIFLDEFSKKISDEEIESTRMTSKNRNKFFKTSRIILYIFLITSLILSYVLKDNSGSNYFNSKSLWIMLLRSVIIMVLWFKVFAPLLGKLLRSKLMKSKNKYSSEIHYTLNALPLVKKLSVFTWNKADGKGITKLSNFVSLMIPAILKVNFESK